VRGVVHAAAVAEDRLLPKLDREGFRVSFRPKVFGALMLDHCLNDQPLEFFICCSSVGALLGQTGQANYAAANAFLDAFVHARRARGQPALGVNWGGWYGSGLALSEGGQRTIKGLEMRGVLGFQSSDGVAALNLLLRRNAVQATVVHMDWPRFRQAYPAGEEPPFLSSLATGVRLAAPSDELEEVVPAMRSSLREQLLALESGAARRAMLETHLKSLLAAVLKLETEAIDVEKPLGALGLDSLLGFEFKNRCEKSLRLTLSATIVWNYPTIQTLASHLAEKLGVDLAEESAGRVSETGAKKQQIGPAAANKVVESVEQLSEEEVLDALLKGRTR